MKYMLKKNIAIDFGIAKQYGVAKRIGIHEVTLSNILNRKVSTTKAVALYITLLNGGTEKNIEDFFEIVKKEK